MTARKLGMFAVAATYVFVAACSKTTIVEQQAPGQSSTAPAEQAAQPQTATYATSESPADGNLAPVQNASYQVPASGQASYADGSYPDYDTQEAPVYAPQPPPELPEYSQPACPQDDEIWTPGYWNYGSGGYYWVPGVWVMAPYVGALWTPPYWAFESNRYRLHRGFWAPHIGFYGGINYGFGYVGSGYYGGYWRANTFYYNRSVTNVNVTVIRNVYDYHVNVRNDVRVSYVGGNGGLRVRPTPAELAVMHEQIRPPIAAQVQHTNEAARDRALFAATNHGRPPAPAVARPLDVGYRAPAPRPAFAEARAMTPNRTEPNRGPEGRPVTQNRPATEARPGPEARPQDTRQEARPILGGGRPAPSPPTQPRPAPESRVEQHPAAQRVENRPAPAPRMEQRPTPEPRVEQRPVPVPRQEARPAPVPHVEERPAPAPRVDARPAPAPAAHAEPPHPAPQAAPHNEPHPGPHPEQKKADHP